MRMNGSLINLIVWSLFISFFITSCAGVQSASFKAQLAQSNCNQQTVFNYSKEDIPKPIHTLELDTVLVSRFSIQSLNAANANGFLDLLTNYVKLKKDNTTRPSLEKRVQIIETAQKINQKINLASLEISAIASEIDCEEERADQVATYLKGKEDDTESKLTVGAIVIGAAGAIAEGALLTSHSGGDASDVIGIGVGLTEATLGIMILLNKRKIEFYHPRNALKDIWTSPETSTIFPPSVWYYLTYENPNLAEKSLRKQLIDKWMGFGQISDSKEKNKEKLYDLYFGKGGKYTSEQLKNRANMYDQIEAQIKLMKQNLTVLSFELEKFNEEQ